MVPYRTPFGLPVRYKGETGRHVENEFLFGMYEYMFTNRKPLKSDHPLVAYYNRAYVLGFPNHVEHVVAEKKISHDQLTAYICYSMLFGVKGAKLIQANMGLSRYEALGQSISMHPRDVLYYKLLQGVWYAILLLPIVYLLAAFSMLVGYRINMHDGVDRPQNVKVIGPAVLQRKLSGELLYVLKVYAVKDHKLLRLAMEPVRWLVLLGAKMRFGSVQNMVRSYFVEQDDHPIVKDYNFKL